MEAAMSPSTQFKEIEGKRYSYADYLGWPEDERWEIIDGEAYCMTPAPSTKHQLVLQELLGVFRAFFADRRCVPFVAPTDVVFDAYNVVQPDLLVVCDKSKITPANVQGAPDLVVEVLSPWTGVKDHREKKALYERCGVAEYLLIHPMDELVYRFRLVDGRYAPADIFNWDETLTSFAFPDLTLNLWEIFEKEVPAPPKPRPVPAGEES